MTRRPPLLATCIVIVLTIVGLSGDARLLYGGQTTKDAEHTKVPVLSTDERKDLQLLVKDLEIWQLKAQQAASEFEKARAALTQKVGQLTPPGWRLTDTLVFEPVPPPVPAKAP